MAQFDVYANPSPAQREAFPYLVVIQSDQLDRVATRLVMPLARMSVPAAALPRRLSQPVDIGGERLYPAAQLCAPLPARLLREPVASLRHASASLVDALDAVVGGV
ncbi:CcdB family protein [Azohydromonas sediminis]|uniref:CcdB family protein n=1 Tax=Azohydromonas sediminis TaxID=2259674 RepID=UPI000E658204|nr:CcdB family protein [Azohydromonas sediminis]